MSLKYCTLITDPPYVMREKEKRKQEKVVLKVENYNYSCQNNSLLHFSYATSASVFAILHLSTRCPRTFSPDSDTYLLTCSSFPNHPSLLTCLSFCLITQSVYVAAHSICSLFRCYATDDFDLPGNLTHKTKWSDFEIVLRQ